MTRILDTAGFAFGTAAVKREGSSMPVDKAHPGDGREADESDWMELNIPRKASRKAVHAMVDEWLDDKRGPHEQTL